MAASAAPRCRVLNVSSLGPRGLRRNKIIFFMNTQEAELGILLGGRGLCLAFTRLWFQPSVLQKQTNKKS